MTFSDYLIALPMVVAVISLWFSRRVWILFFLAALVAGVWGGRLTGLGLLSIAMGFGLALLIARLNDAGKASEEEQDTSWLSKSITVGLSALLTVWVLMTFYHLLPGFNNVLLLDKVQVSSDAIPFTLYFNLDKAASIFVLFVAMPGLLTTGKTIAVGRYHCWIILAGFFLIQALACWPGLIRPEFKIPSWWWLFAINNLVITCVAEEALFRGYLQQRLGQLWGWVPAWLLLSLLFGALHIQGGWVYAGFVVLAGLLYGFVFQVTGRLWAAVLIQFLLNFTHLIFYTYPMLKSAV